MCRGQKNPVAYVVAENVELLTIAVDRAVQHVNTSACIGTSGGTIQGINQMPREMAFGPVALISLSSPRSVLPAPH